MVSIEGWKTDTSVSQLVKWQCFCTFPIPLLLCLQRSVAKVEWSAGGPANIYRVGHKGKVMLIRQQANVSTQFRSQGAQGCIIPSATRMLLQAPRLLNPVDPIGLLSN